MTPTKLRNHTFKDLAQMAKRQGVSGWHSMRKEELIRALVSQASRKSRQSKKKPSDSVSCERNHPNGAYTPSAHGQAVEICAVDRPPNEFQARLEAFRSLAAKNDEVLHGESRDRLVVMVRDPYWLHAVWELSHRSIVRARSALGQNWHRAQPTLRLYKVADDGSAAFLRDVAIHGGVDNWYLDVQDPPCAFRLEIGYAVESRPFFCLARSNTVTTPPVGSGESRDNNWADVADNADRIYAMSGGYSPQGTSLELQELLEERLQRPMGSPVDTRYGDQAARVLFQPDELRFAIDAELVIYGASHPQAHVTVKGEPVQLRQDGTFSVRMNLPDRRQVVPVVASSSDGAEQRTIILAVERNTKVLEPMHREPGSHRSKR
jgi:hypothetical protein